MTNRRLSGFPMHRARVRKVRDDLLQLGHDLGESHDTVDALMRITDALDDLAIVVTALVQEEVKRNG